ncbi:MAG: chaperone modulator CbpM [Rhodospirillaceae bacterium]
MITTEALISLLPDLERSDLERWVSNAWVRPDQEADQYLFHEIDVARVQLICELRDILQVNEEAMPVVLSLLDQLYALRRRVHALGTAANATTPDALRQDLAALLRSPG